MSSTVHEARVTKPKPKARAKAKTTPSQRRSPARRNQFESPGLGQGDADTDTDGRLENDDHTRDNLFPLVERTNALPVSEFQSLYAPETSPQDRNRDTDNAPLQEQPANSTRRRPMNYTLDLYSAASIPTDDFEACFALIEFTSSGAYKGSSVGWAEGKKRKEMKLPDMRYLIVRNMDTKWTEDDSGKSNVLGFLSFMVTYEDGKEVVYCYEIHLQPTAQGLGLGRKLMLTMEDIGRRIGLEKAMLTVFKSNTRALDFYQRRLGFGVDEYSPRPRKLRNGTVKEPDYLILSKRLDEHRDHGQ